MGTEKIEEDLSNLFPDAIIKRMDLDTTSRKNSHQDIISNFENRNIQFRHQKNLSWCQKTHFGNRKI